MATPKLEAFDIRNFLERLEPTKEKGKYVCPVCAGNNLSIKADTGAYKCWNGCEEKDVREAIRPWAEVVGSPDVASAPMGQRRKPATRSDAPKPVPLPQGEIALIRCNPTPLPTPQTPQWKPKGVPDECKEIVYRYSPTQSVHRFQWVDESKLKGRDKTFRQCHLNGDGLPEWNKGSEQWPAYRENEVIDAIADIPADVAPVLLIQEGEGCVDIALEIGLASVTFQGSAWNRADIERFLKAVSAASPRTIIVFLTDADATGEKKAQVVSESCNACGVPFVALSANIFLSNNMTPEEYLVYCENNPSGDIKEILDSMSSDEFIRRLEEEIHRAIDERSREADDTDANTDAPDSFNPVAEFTQKALEILYGDEPWICVSDRLYKWQGTYYKELPDALELRRLSSFCNGYAVRTAQGIRYPYAKPSKVRELLEWVKMRLAIDPKDVNPGGTNFTNGVLELSWDGSNVSRKLEPHDPNRHLYLYEPLATFNPDADPQHCDRLLEALDKPQREIFLRTIAATFDLSLVRAHRGREVRALLLKGDGSNGKDSLRELVSLMYGRKGITSCTFDDFAQADNGRKFPVAVLEHSRVNWPSENSGTKRLDKLQSAKVAITGDPFTIERKGQDPYDVELKCVHLFNINDSPNLSAALEAIGTRYGVLSFTKTFSPHPDPSKGELKADPRFKYDPQFVREKVLPAFVNRVLEAFSDLMREGIDYSATNPALSAIQCESNHLWQFALDTGLHVANGGKLYAGDIWQKLKDWYVANGTLEIEITDKKKEKAIWYEMANRSDRLCKAANQVPARIGAIFPKAKKGRDEGGTFLTNLAWGQGDGPGKGKISLELPDAMADANCVIPDAMADAVILMQQVTDATDAIFQSRCEKNSEKIDSTSEATFDFSQEEESEIASVASASLPVSDTASATASEIASASLETASGDSDWTIEGSLATTEANEGDAIMGLAPLELDGIAPTEEDLAMLTEDMLAAVADNDLDLFNALRELYPVRWLQRSAHQIQLNNPAKFETILEWLKAPALRADTSDVLVGDVPEVAHAVPESEPQFIATVDEVVPDAIGASATDAAPDADAFNFPGVGDLIWRAPISSEWNAKTKQRKPAQPGCVCRIVKVDNNGAIAQSSSDGSQFHISWHAWQSGLFVPYWGQDRR